MIKAIIKRDGTKQPFDADKINGWGQWAAKTLGNSIDWGGIVLSAVQTCDEETTSEALQQALIRACLDRPTWAYNRMAGRLYCALQRKKCYGKTIPTIKELHTRMVAAGILSEKFANAYTDEEYAELEATIDHSRDLTYAYYQHTQFRTKYAMRDRVNDIDYETPQFVHMRVAMRLAMNLPNRIETAKKFYYYFSTNKINIPTPYYTNSGTEKNGFLSCCLYTTNDTAPSLAAGDHIAYMMTVNSSGIGANIRTRAIGSSVRGGIIRHQGKFPYYKALGGAINANMQNGRGGAATATFSVYDPQVLDIQKLKNPRSPDAKRNRDLDYAMAFNRHFAKKAAKGETYHTFDMAVAPEIYEAVNASEEEFERLYNKAVEEGRFVSELNAREVLLSSIEEAVSTGRQYLTDLTAANIHTPIKNPIYNSNLCQEILLPTAGYDSVGQLYKEEESGEVAMCALAGIVVGNIKDDDEYADVAHHALLMIDVAIRETEYPLPQIAFTAKKRMSAAVGIVGLAHYMAKNKQSYTTTKGKAFMHELAETHYWHLLNASLRLGKEFGNAEWIDRTKWPEGWLPVDTYYKSVDEVTPPDYKRDWESLRQAVIANKGIRNSVLVAHAPTESSSISSGTTNGLYPIRDIALLKTNESGATSYVVPDSDKLEPFYDNAYEIELSHIIDCYGIFQKFCDQGISADLYVNVAGTNKLSSSQLLRDQFRMIKLGVKSRYYINSKTGTGIDLGDKCESCTL